MVVSLKVFTTALSCERSLVELYTTGTLYSEIQEFLSDCAATQSDLSFYIPPMIDHA